MQSLTLSPVTVALLIALFSFPGFSAEYRTWTADVEGFPVEAMYRGYDSRTIGDIKRTTVRLQKKEDGTVLSVPLEKLSKADQDHVHALQEKARIEREKRRMENTTEEKEKRKAESEAEKEKRQTEWDERVATKKADMKKNTEEWRERRAAERAKEEELRTTRRAESEKRQTEWKEKQAAKKAEWEKSQAEAEARRRMAEISARTEHRTWTDRDKKFRVEAKLVDFDGANVRLKRKDNAKILSIALEKLSLADQDYVKATTAEFTGAGPDFVEYASPDGSFKGRVPVIELSSAPVIRTDGAPMSWSTDPDPAKDRKSGFKPKNLTFRFGKQEQLADFEGIRFCDGAPEKILTGISSRGQKTGGSGTFFFGDTKTGAIHAKTYPVRTKIFGLSPDGTKALLGHVGDGSDTIVYLAVVDTTRPQLPCIGAFQVGNRSKIVGIDGADWVDEQHLLIRGDTTLVLVRFEDGTAVWSMRAHDVAAFSPEKKYFVATTFHGRLLAETATGRPIGRIVPAEGEKFRFASKLSFSSDGAKIAVQESLVPRGGLIHLVELKTGVAGEPFYIDSDHGTNMCWIDDRHILCCGHMTGGTLADTVERVPVWVYTGCDWNTVFSAGRLWHTPGFGHNDVAFSVSNAPALHPDMSEFPSMTEAQKYGVRPGLEVRLTVDESIPDSDKLHEHVTKILTDNGLHVVPKAPLTLAVRMQAEQPVEVTYKHFMQLMSSSGRSVGKATFTPHTYSFSFERGNRTLWTVRQNMLTPNLSTDDLKGGKTIQEAVTEKTTPRSDWYFRVEIPSRIPVDNAGRSLPFP